GVAAGGPVTITAMLPAALGSGSASASVRVVDTAARVASISGMKGGVVGVPIELVSPGGVNALGFSLQFDPLVLTDPQAALGNDASGAQLQVNSSQTAQGRLGLIMALPAGQQISAGTRRIITVNFTIAANASNASTSITFSDQPTPSEVADTAGNLIPAAFIPGVVTIVPVFEGFEADVAPRPNGNGVLTVSDWVQMGR